METKIKEEIKLEFENIDSNVQVTFKLKTVFGGKGQIQMISEVQIAILINLEIKQIIS